MQLICIYGQLLSSLLFKVRVLCSELLLLIIVYVYGNINICLIITKMI